MAALIVRHRAWEEALAVYLDRVHDVPFAWGVHDCALFAAGAVRAMTGIDPAADFRGQYEDVRGAALALRALGAGTLYHTTCQWLGAPVHAAQARRGDVVMRGKALGICVGARSWFVGDDLGRAGLVDMPTLDCRHAWHIDFPAAAPADKGVTHG